MNLAYYIQSSALLRDKRVLDLFSNLEGAGCNLYAVSSSSDIMSDTGILLSIGGDGTYLSAAAIASQAGIPILGVNFGRLGFLSEIAPEDAVSSIINGDYTIRERTMLQVDAAGRTLIALNEFCVSRVGAAMLGVDVEIDGVPLPTCWGDGFLVSTPSGSTAYSLSVGGPICLPETSALIVAPIAPHNLNVRPVVVPETARLVIRPRSRDRRFLVSADNVRFESGYGEFAVSAAPVRLKYVVTGKSNFIDALKSRLMWGQDVRNTKEQ